MVETLGGVPAHEELAEGVCRSGFFEEYEGNIFHSIDQLFDEIASDPSKLSDIISSVKDEKLILTLIKECKKREFNIWGCGFFENCHLTQECFVEISYSCECYKKVYMLVKHRNMDSSAFFAIVENQNNDRGFLYQFFECWLELQNATL